MKLTPQEQTILGLLRSDPLLDTAGLAERLGTTKASVSVALSNLTRKGAILGRGYLVRPESAVVVVGGAVMDIKARSASALATATSNPGHVTTNAGGVGRNIAENLARLGTPTHLVAALGADAFGEDLLEHTRAAGVHLDHVVVGTRPTGTYLAVLDHEGDLNVAVSDMTATDALTVADLEKVRSLVQHSALLVVDGNVPVEVTAWLLETARSSGVQVVLEPVSVVKAARMGAVLSPDRPVLAMTPNIDELAALVGRDVPNNVTEISRAAAELHDRGVEHVWVRRGARGSLLSSRATDTTAATDPAATELATPTVTTNDLIATDVVDVTGAGDSMTAGFVHAWLRDPDAVGAAAYGQATAALTTESAHTVRPDLTDALVTERLTHQGKK
ncbi:carbohydrate kinase [Knoellia sinensis KCTC 19936]|uniref:Carbohydrate kinase n=1 Tax=Knoellia sinensis KCTC 19936 TaxID=1385520 RepID=A0A0A0J9T9_9MICO|nr:PfkB family carbohydrate kinase [Knoellia sinensis]KGN32812.1 carbohydrate kinase [Knoellia sinensis KCTC 19936]